MAILILMGLPIHLLSQGRKEDAHLGGPVSSLALRETSQNVSPSHHIHHLKGEAGGGHLREPCRMPAPAPPHN